MEAAIVCSGGEVPDELGLLVDLFAEATHQPAVLTYEELIYINPQTDMRTFTMGEVGASERDFYTGHLRIEQLLEEVQRKLGNTQFALENASVDKATMYMKEANQAFAQTLGFMRSITMTMKPDHFAAFRRYLTSHPTRKLNGPGGAFTAAIPVIDMRLAGEYLPETYLDYVQTNYQYFPRNGRKEINLAANLIQEGKTLTALAQRQGNPTSLMEEMRRLSSVLREFRLDHYKGVKYQIPAVFAGEEAGTAGESNVQRFLSDRIKIKHVKGGDHES